MVTIENPIKRNDIWLQEVELLFFTTDLSFHGKYKYFTMSKHVRFKIKTDMS